MAMNEALIVGAGPTGLTLAAEFQRFGIPFRLIDKSNHGAKYSQALVVQARTLEQLERHGLAEEAVKQGRQLQQATLISEGKTIVSIPFDKIPSRYPFVLFLPQNETEKLLIDHLQSVGVEIERGVELNALQENGSDITVELRRDNGSVEHTSANGWWDAMALIARFAKGWVFRFPDLRWAFTLFWAILNSKGRMHLAMNCVSICIVGT